MKGFYVKNKKMILLSGFLIILIAGLLDIKYEGLLYQLLETVMK